MVSLTHESNRDKMPTFATILHYRNYLVGGVFAIIFLWENIIPQRKFSNIFLHNLKNFGYGAINLTISFGGGYYFSKYLDWSHVHNKFSICFASYKWQVIISILCADILMYWWHRFNHTIYFLWKFHALHHQDEAMNSTTAVRFHIIELLFSFIFRAVFYPLLGIDSTILLLFSTLHFMMIVFHHSNVYITDKIDLIIRLFITSPGMHRIHHSNKWQETNSNYTSILSCWDWIFRTYVKKSEKDIQFGIPANLETLRNKKGV